MLVYEEGSIPIRLKLPMYIFPNADFVAQCPFAPHPYSYAMRPIKQCKIFQGDLSEINGWRLALGWPPHN